MRHFVVYYLFNIGINGPRKKRHLEVSFDDIDPETSDKDLKRMAHSEVDQRFKQSDDFPLYGKFWEVTDIEEVFY